MITPEQFKENEYKYGCGYWNVCWEHACPCAITTENKGLREDIYNGFIKENQEMIDDMNDDDYDDRLPCGCCAYCGCTCDDNGLDDFYDYED